MCMTKYIWSVVLMFMIKVVPVVDCTNNDDTYSSCKKETVMKKVSSCKKVFVDQGETVVLQCNISSTNSTWLGPSRSEKPQTADNPLITYIDRGQVNPIVDNTSFNFKYNQYGTYDLEISNFTQEQDGKYICQHAFQKKTGMDIYKVFLKRPPTNLTIHNKKENHTVLGEVGKNLTLICTVNSGKPTEKLQWGRDGKVFNKTTHGVIYYTFTPNLSYHMSSFTCSANSPLLEKPLQETVQLNIHYKPVLNLSLSSLKPVEGTSIKICCVSDSNPMTKYVVWMKHESTIKNETSSQNCMVIQTLHRSDAGVYTCSAVNEIGFSKEGTELQVLYPPNVTVSLHRLRNHIELTCIPRGLPNNFSFFQWEHQSEFQEHIRYINGTSNGTLIIYRTENENVLYQDNGIYICKVSNNIPDVHGQVLQQEEILVLPEAPQILFKNTSRIQFGRFGQDRNITIYIQTIYRQQEPITSSLIKADSPIPNLIATNHLTTIEDIRHGVKIKVRVIQLTFTLKSLMEDDFANFTVKVCNRYGCHNTSIQMCSASRPEPPTNLTLSTEGTSLKVKWISGFNGGFMQEFYIEYRSYRTSKWTMIGPINSSNTVLKDLVPGTVYEVRIFARNTAGDSERTNITEIKTLDHEKKLLLPWVVLPILVVLVVIGTIITIVIKRKDKCKSLHPSNQQDGTDVDLQGVSIENSLYQSFSSGNVAANQMHELIPLSPTSSMSHQTVESEGIPVENQLYHTARGVLFNEERVPNIEGGNRSVSRIDENTVISESSLNYAEVIFESGSSANIIHGDQERAIYSEIDLAATAQMGPVSSSSENESDDDYMYVDDIQQFERKT